MGLVSSVLTCENSNDECTLDFAMVGYGARVKLFLCAIFFPSALL